MKYIPQKYSREGIDIANVVFVSHFIPLISMMLSHININSEDCRFPKTVYQQHNEVSPGWVIATISYNIPGDHNYYMTTCTLGESKCFRWQLK